jgi:hypothetical protein
MTQSSAWLLQIHSDSIAAKRVLRHNDPSTFCQAVAKYQQVVEKSIKAMVAVVLELGIEFTTINSNHKPYKEMQALTNLARVIDSGSVEFIRNTFTVTRQADIEELCDLAPNYPEPGKPFLRNTEYPYNDAQGRWTAPAANDSFGLKDVKRFYELAWVLHVRATKFAQSVQLRPGHIN